MELSQRYMAITSRLRYWLHRHTKDDLPQAAVGSRFRCAVAKNVSVLKLREGGSLPRTARRRRRPGAPACLYRNQADDRFAQALAGLSQPLEFAEPATLDLYGLTAPRSPLPLLGC